MSIAHLIKPIHILTYFGGFSTFLIFKTPTKSLLLKAYLHFLHTGAYLCNLPRSAQLFTINSKDTIITNALRQRRAGGELEIISSLLPSLRDLKRDKMQCKLWCNVEKVPSSYTGKNRGEEQLQVSMWYDLKLVWSGFHGNVNTTRASMVLPLIKAVQYKVPFERFWVGEHQCHCNK